MPDFLNGEYAEHSWFPANTPEKQKALGAYFQGPGNFGKAHDLIPGIIKEIEGEADGKITKWAALGLCWGGKVCQSCIRFVGFANVLLFWEDIG